MMLFYVPGFIWRKMNKNCGIDSKIITKALAEMDPLNSELRKEPMAALVKHIDKALTYHREYHHGFMWVLFSVLTTVGSLILRYSTWRRFSCLLCCTIGQRSGNYLSAGYILVKLFYILLSQCDWSTVSSESLHGQSISSVRIRNDPQMVLQSRRRSRRTFSTHHHVSLLASHPGR